VPGSAQGGEKDGITFGCNLVGVSVAFLAHLAAQDSLVREKVVIIICSTTGDGDPPDNAAKFVRFLRKKSLANDILKNLKFTVLGTFLPPSALARLFDSHECLTGLGNTNYTNFCNTAKYINSR
jgi:methionine synthase reductase